MVTLIICNFNEVLNAKEPLYDPLDSIVKIISSLPALIAHWRFHFFHPNCASLRHWLNWMTKWQKTRSRGMRGLWKIQQCSSCWSGWWCGWLKRGAQTQSTWWRWSSARFTAAVGRRPTACSTISPRWDADVKLDVESSLSSGSPHLLEIHLKPFSCANIFTLHSGF